MLFLICPRIIHFSFNQFILEFMSKSLAPSDKKVQTFLKENIQEKRFIN